jgi:superfamily II DNA/RNA helicase
LPPLHCVVESDATFDELGVPSEFVSVLAAQGITSPLPIQAASIPDALAGRDVCGMAPTGSGKTLAFAIPMAARIGRGTPRRPRGLILAPTRELAMQIAVELAPIARARGLSVHAFYGGVGFGPQWRALRRGLDIVVACPGRLGDLMRSGEADLSEVEMVVIDEADRMADMGFLPDVRRILDTTPGTRQTLLFSATLDGDVDVLVRRYQSDPVRHEIESDADDLSRMTHEFRVVAASDRAATAADAVTAAGGPTMVFVRTRHGADRLAKQLVRAGVPTAAIHGDRSQGQRERALESFRAGKVWALVATDVAARGIHVDGVACVVHFDLPADAKTYVHRSGRTGRVGASGTVVTLVTPEQSKEAAVLRRDLGMDASGTIAPRARGAGRAGSPRPAQQQSEHRPSSPARRPVSRRGAARLAGRSAAVTPITAISSRRSDRTPSRPAGQPGRARPGSRPDSDPRREGKAMAYGTVKWFNPSKGYGFIAPDDGVGDVFVHESVLVPAGRRMAEGQRVMFASEPAPKGLQATAVRPA